MIKFVHMWLQGSLPFRTFWPVWAALGLPVLLTVLNATPVGLNFVFVVLGEPLLACVWGISGAVALILSVQRLRKRHWTRAAILVVLPVSVVAASFLPLRLLHFCNDGGDVLYFLLRKEAFQGSLQMGSSNQKPRLEVFDRGGMSWASRGYVYDESDQVAREPRLQTAAWKARAEGTELTCGYYAQPFPGHLNLTRHWYLASFDC